LHHKAIVFDSEVDRTFLPQNGQHTVLDPFAGTGTTLIAAMELGHQVIGVEIEQRYCTIIEKRLQESLFDVHQTTQEIVDAHVT
jgi:predicted RNA methylase